MAKFVMECPNCGKYVQARTGFFAKKKIDCACGYTINVRTDKLASRTCTHCGIGRELMKKAHELAGGERDIAVYLIANDNAVPFYEKLGMTHADDVMRYDKVDWTDFTVE